MSSIILSFTLFYYLLQSEVWLKNVIFLTLFSLLKSIFQVVKYFAPHNPRHQTWLHNAGKKWKFPSSPHNI